MNGERAARLFYAFCGLAGAAVLAGTVLSAAGLLPIASWAGLFRPLIFRFGLVLAAGVFSVAALAAYALKGGGVERPRTGAVAFAASSYLIRGLCLSTALGFLATELGKLLHMEEMRQFFLASGLPVVLLYVVMIGETLGSIGLLVPSVRLVAACGLILVMVGAVGTHVHNGDPWSDSYEALHMLAVLGSIVLVGILRERVPGAGVIESTPTSPRRTR